MFDESKVFFMNRPTLLLLPGTLNDEAVWKAQTDQLEVNFCVADLTQQNTTSSMAEHAISSLQSGPFFMAGFSLGGYVAFEIMRRASNRIKGLALISTSARPELIAARAGREEMMALAQKDFPQLTSKLIQFMLPTARHSDVHLVKDIQDMMNRVGADAFVRQSQAVMNRADSRDILTSIRSPTIVISGNDDRVAAPKFSEEMANLIPGAELHFIEETGHMAPMERPNEVTSLLKTWLEQLN